MDFRLLSQGERIAEKANRVFDACDAILDARRNAWNRLANQPARITAIASRAHEQVTFRCRVYDARASAGITPCTPGPACGIMPGMEWYAP